MFTLMKHHLQLVIVIIVGVYVHIYICYIDGTILLYKLFRTVFATYWRTLEAIASSHGIGTTVVREDYVDTLEDLLAYKYL